MLKTGFQLQVTVIKRFWREKKKHYQQPNRRFTLIACEMAKPPPIISITFHANLCCIVVQDSKVFELFEHFAFSVTCFFLLYQQFNFRILKPKIANVLKFY